jgi:hypothetical protein
MKKNIVLLFCLALLSLGTVVCAPSAHANGKVGEYIGDDGTVYEAYEGDDWYVIFYTRKNGEKGEFYVPKDGNPDPDGSSKGTSKPDVKELLKKAGVKYDVHKNPENTPLGGILNGQGKGFNPRGNPGDDTSHDKGPSAPHDGSADYKKTPKQLEQERAQMNMDARIRGNMKGGMYDGTEGGSESPTGPGNHDKGKNNGGSDDSSYKDHQNKNVGKTYDLGPRPDLINPNPGDPTSKGIVSPRKTNAAK